jgi:tRNA/rRNA methyltransferase
MMDHLRIVLVKSKYPRNVGMVARAMSHYGLKHLILIDPQCELDEEAREGASHAQEILRSAVIYPHWQRFYDWEHEGIRIAFSARDGQNRETFDFSNSLRTDLDLHAELKNKMTYLIFGTEDHGLADADLDFVHRVFQMKVPGENQSMNLSHAVMTALTMMYDILYWEVPTSVETEKESIFFPEQTIKKWLETLNFDLTKHQKVNAHKVLKRLVLKSFPTQKELHMLETVLQQTIRKLKDKKTGLSEKPLEAEKDI